MESVKKYLVDLGCFNPKQIQTLLARFSALDPKYQQIARTYITNKTIDNLTCQGLTLANFLAYDGNIISAVCNYVELEQHPELATLIKAGINVIEDE